MLLHPVQRWTITAVAPPQPLLHCSSCRSTRAHVSSGKIRLNANGKMLDAWLIYRCVACDNTWNRTVFERRHVNRIATQELDALQQSDAAYVAKVEFDMVGLATCVVPDDVVVERDRVTVQHDFDITFSVPTPVGIRLGKLLARELGVSRNAIERMVEPASLLRKPVKDGVRVRVKVMTIK